MLGGTTCHNHNICKQASKMSFDASTVRRNHARCAEVFMVIRKKFLLVCSFCDEIYSNLEAFGEHLREGHSNSVILADDYTFDMKEEADVLLDTMDCQISPISGENNLSEYGEEDYDRFEVESYNSRPEQTIIKIEPGGLDFQETGIHDSEQLEIEEIYLQMDSYEPSAKKSKKVEISKKTSHSHREIVSNDNSHRSSVPHELKRLPQTSFVALEFEFIPGKRYNSSLLFSRTENQIYTYNGRNSIGKSYLCTYGRPKSCNARVFLIDDDTKCVKLKDKYSHNHPERLTERSQLIVLNEIKKRCGQLELFMSSKRLSTRDIFNQVLFENPDVYLDFKKSERTLQTIRDQATPKNPTNCAEIQQVFSDEEVFNIFGRSELDKSIFFDAVVEKDAHSFCVFSSKSIISLVENNVETSQRHFLVDSTFKQFAIGPFQEMLVIHVEYKKYVFPFIYVLMSRKTEQAYFDVFSYIHENVLNLDCQHFTVGYENALRNALTLIFPNLSISPSWFLFVQSVKRYASRIKGFRTFLHIHERVNDVFIQMLVLPLFPLSYILSMFDSLKEIAYGIDQNKFMEFFIYFKRRWLDPERTVKLRIFEHDIQTSFSLEASNIELSKCIAKHKNFYLFVRLLLQQESVVSIDMSSFIETDKMSESRLKRIYATRYKKIERLTKQLSRGEIIGIEAIRRFLRSDCTLCGNLSIIDHENINVADDESVLKQEILADLQGEIKKGVTPSSLSYKYKTTRIQIMHR